MSRTITDLAPTAAPPLRMSYEEWLAWNHEDLRSEWVDGEVIVLMSNSVRHGQIMVFLVSLLSQYVRFFGLGEVFAETLEMKLAASARLPDVLFVARRNLGRLDDQRLQGPADLAVEIVSPDSVARDRDQKRREYGADGVLEYWLFDPRSPAPTADFLRLIDGVYRSVPTDPDGRYHSIAVPGFWFRPDWLAQDPLPDVLTCLAEMAPEVLNAALRAAAPRNSAPGA